MQDQRMLRSRSQSTYISLWRKSAWSRPSRKVWYSPLSDGQRAFSPKRTERVQISEERHVESGYANIWWRISYTASAYPQNGRCPEQGLSTEEHKDEIIQTP
jgi:hypothetical protein